MGRTDSPRPIPFIGSNPSISRTERHRTWQKSGGFKIGYFENHFGGIKQRAAEILEREPEPGSDYAVTWVVRRKSTGGIGVGRAARECSTRYPRRAILASNARLIVVPGRHARAGIADLFGVPAGDTASTAPSRRDGASGGSSASPPQRQAAEGLSFPLFP